MAIEVVPGTPLEKSLQSAVQPKLVEMGWSTDGLDDSALAEYIVLMLVNGKTQDQIAAELSNDLLGLDSEDSGPIIFAKWLFDQVDHLGGRANEVHEVTLANDALQNPRLPDGYNLLSDRGEHILSQAQDEEMGDAVESSQAGTVPTGPKSMREGIRPAGNKRILGQLNRAMDRTPDAPLHKIKGTAGTGRINAHTREPPKGPTPKGPRSQMIRNQGTLPPRPTQNIPTGLMGQMPQNTAFGTMTPQQQMQLFAMYEEQARMMAQILSPQQQQMFPTQMAFNQPQFASQPQQPSKSLFERVDTGGSKPSKFNRRPYQNGHQSQKPYGMDVETMEQSVPNLDPTSSMEVEQSSQPTGKPDPGKTVCHFNLTCTKPDCPFVHQSPAAPPGTTVDMSDTCSFGAACKNRKCVGKHPSPAKIAIHKAQEECKFFPNCKNPTCHFIHPSMPPCRNGADCTVPGCKFSHVKTACRFDPCLNPSCLFKHVAGQKRGIFQDKVWINTEEGGEDGANNQKEHVSERKFIDDDEGEEDLILPGKNGIEEVHPAEGLIV